MAEPYIELWAFLKIIGKASSGGQAKLLIQDSKVKVNGTVETRVRKKLTDKTQVEIEGKTYTVDFSVIKPQVL